MTTIQLSEASRWYGEVIALNGIDLSFGPGVTGLLGPNGAGKTTLLRLIVGLIRPTTGTVQVLGEPVWGSVEMRRRVGYCPESDRFYEDMTGLDFVTLMTRLNGFGRKEAQERAASALQRVRLDQAASEKKVIGAYSKGMRQKVKLAQAMAHEPEVIILDEPLTGTDPLSRHQISDLCCDLGESGCTVIVSSHVLHEVERMTRQFVLIDRGRKLAEGDVQTIRALIDRHPHSIELACSDSRRLAAALVALPHVLGVDVSSDQILTVRTSEPDEAYDAVVQLALSMGVDLHRLRSPDNNLEAVFRYLTGGR